MKLRKSISLLIRVSFVFLTFTSASFASYVEGTDTTDVDGYGLDSSFRVLNGYITGQDIITRYCFSNFEANGYFNYSFDDINSAPEVIRQSISPSKSGDMYYCFIVKSKDSTYSKIQLQKQISGNQYIYRYGKNTTPNDRLLIRPDYDKNYRFKPRNVWNHLVYNDPQLDTLCWEEPLANNNHLIGYIFYYSKIGAVIDTTLPVNLSQWDTVVLSSSMTQSTSLHNYIDYYGRYYSLVANYSEGKSDFLTGWTKFGSALILDVAPRAAPSNPPPHRNLEVTRSGNGYFIRHANSGVVNSIMVLNPAGAKVACFSGIKENRVFWQTGSVPEGMYLIRAEYTDGGTVARSIVVSR